MGEGGGRSSPARDAAMNSTLRRFRMRDTRQAGQAPPGPNTGLTSARGPRSWTEIVGRSIQRSATSSRSSTTTTSRSDSADTSTPANSNACAIRSLRQASPSAGRPAFSMPTRCPAAIHLPTIRRASSTGMPASSARAIRASRSRTPSTACARGPESRPAKRTGPGPPNSQTSAPSGETATTRPRRHVSGMASGSMPVLLMGRSTGVIHDRNPSGGRPAGEP